LSFDTVTFWLFFALAWPLWRFLPFAAAKSAALLLSLVFYGWWNPLFLLLIGASALTDYFIGLAMHRRAQPAERRGLLMLSLTVNLGLLAVFKYGAFAAQNASDLAGVLGADVDWRLEGWIVPVGISFYTFQTLSYSIDIYRGRLVPTKSFRDFFLYVAFFPQLVAGPIVRASELLPQFNKRRRLTPAVLQTGLYFIVTGLFLKIVIADNLAGPVEGVFSMSALPTLSAASVWLGVIYFGVQIFADFAGYSGIAIGLAYVMGLRFPLNFDSPYVSRGLSEFWTRWHISLSGWLRDYLYVPLGGNRGGRSATYVNLSITMLLGGLWHGASWTFVAWGALHAIGLCAERALRGDSRRPTRERPSPGLGYVGAGLQILVVFVFVQTTWVFFRAESFAMAWLVLERMYVAPFSEGLGAGDVHIGRYLLLAAPVALLHFGQLGHEWFGLRKTAYRRAAVAGVMLFLLVVVHRGSSSEFLYFQF
jgi:alginate O-acetyltransferase complex protein AlgI